MSLLFFTTLASAVGAQAILQGHARAGAGPGSTPGQLSTLSYNALPKVTYPVGLSPVTLSGSPVNDAKYSDYYGRFAPHARLKYDALFIDTPNIPPLMAGTNYVYEVRVKNVGTAPWTSTARIRLLGLYNASLFGFTQADMAPGAVVWPGNDYTFTIPLKAPVQPGTYKIGFLMTAKNSNGPFGPLYATNVTVYRIENPRISINNTWQPKAFRLRGNLHAHTQKNVSAGYGSDGMYNASYLLSRIYRDLAGEDFCAITDHHVYTPDPGVPGIIYVPGAEAMTLNGEMTVLNISASPPRGVTVDVVIDYATRGRGGLISFAHSTMFLGSDSHDWTGAELDRYAINGSLIECYNGGMECINWSDYDRMLCNGTRVWLSAVDDYHASSDQAFSPWGWVVVNADEKTNTSIVEALRAGNFYASTGAAIEDITVEGNTIRVRTGSPSSIRWIVRGNVTARQTAGVRSDTYAVRGDEGYVRIQVSEMANASRQAWSQPLFVTKGP